MRALWLVLLLPACAHAWGWQGHKLITELAIDHLPAEIRAVYAPVMKQVLDATVEPDKRVFTDTREGPKHYLNVEVLDPAYRAAWRPELPAASKPKDDGEEESRTPPLQLETFSVRMPLPVAEVNRLYAAIPRDTETFFRFPGNYQRELGLVVYQPAHYYGELVKAFRAKDPARIASVTGFLSHYVGDLHVPLHNTVNHDGTFSKSRFLSKGPNSTVHSRFESGLLRFLTPNLKNLAGSYMRAPVAQGRAGITERAIDESREAYAYYPDVIAADHDAMRRFRGNTVPQDRFHATWQHRMAPVAGHQLGRAAQMLADLIVGAWRESLR